MVCISHSFPQLLISIELSTIMAFFKKDVVWMMEKGLYLQHQSVIN